MNMYGITDEAELPEWFVGSADINPLLRVKTQSIMQNHVDTAISSTVNLPESATEEQMAEIYLYAWQCGLKGLTIFRDKCKKAGILTTGSEDLEPEKNACETLPRGYVIPAGNNVIGLRRKIVTGCGNLYCMGFFDRESLELRETFFSKGSDGGCNSSIDGLSRMISTSARGGIPLENIVDQLKSAPTCNSYNSRRISRGDTSPGRCCPDAIGRALWDMHNEILSTRQEIKPNLNSTSTMVKENTISCCPVCGEDLVFTNGCNECKNCGWSKCN